MEIPIDPWKLRSFEITDVVALVKYANNWKVARNLWDSFPHPYTTEDALGWIHYALAKKPETHFAIASPNEVIGGIGFYPQRDIYRQSAEIGLWVGEPFWGKGIATLALKAATEYAFAHLNLVRLYAGVFEWNPASARALEKAGYVFEGRLRKSVVKDGENIDQLMYAIIR
ncbi:MAG: GNAT family N-acetyltransferase [Acidobacteriia bacterium]|nr:GNAT family N-acetyltransferase [Terriglobia bacterium]